MNLNLLASYFNLDGSLPNGDLVLILAACWAGSRTVPDGIIVTSGGPATIKALSKRSFFFWKAAGSTGPSFQREERHPRPTAGGLPSPSQATYRAPTARSQVRNQRSIPGQQLPDRKHYHHAIAWPA